MKIGVVGASGFVGRAVCERLAAESRSVVPIVRSAAGLFNERVSGDIHGATNWTGLLDGIDVLVHAAARVHVMRERPDHALEAFRTINCDGTVNLARRAAEQGVRRFVFISTIKVNGEATSPGRPFQADDPPQPIAPYAVSKFEAECALRDVAAASLMEVVTIRPPLVYGRAARGNFQSMVRWVRRGVPLPLGRIDNNARSMVSIDNLVDLIITCIDHPKAAGETFLVSDGEDVSTASLLRRLGRVTGKAPRLLPVPGILLRAAAGLIGRSVEADRLLGNLQIDIEKTRTRLGWQPPVSLDEGLRRAVISA
ncbi:SDR family oxidoreductase [Sphingosinicella sp. LHD-64]|uniref:UDP-glucose 4-epimerase family protein n=1 Tax=Sphingosinicella sp. LHD-64 TaxID=3072139 RepID=UPI00280DBD81|nr:SDR family oxidoreductase [Sphingosinicella sp. LHD-64]MDQ8757218.1 SDR family oxidoreductase [Sphingosinicella sp. LHD-64]